jgi:hypothetical protein
MNKGHQHKKITTTVTKVPCDDYEAIWSHIVGVIAQDLGMDTLQAGTVKISKDDLAN